nr:hypothetical protein [uncultured Moraxella sp.]
MNIRQILKDENEYTDEQIEKFSEGFLALKEEYEQADIDTVNDEGFQEEIGEKFDELLVSLGFDEFDPDASQYLLYQFWEQDEYKDFITEITIIYRSVLVMSNDVLRNIYSEIEGQWTKEASDENDDWNDE